MKNNTYEIKEATEKNPTAADIRNNWMVQEVRTGKTGKRTILRTWFGTKEEMESLRKEALQAVEIGRAA